MNPLRFDTLDVSTSFQFTDRLDREGNIYVSKLESPVLVHVPKASLVGGLDRGSKWESLEFCDETLLAKFKEVEKAALDACVENKASWFNESVTAEDIAAGFKSFVDDEKKTVRVRVDPEGVECYDIGRHRLVDGPAAGEIVAAVLSASKIAFGKSEFGIVWTLHQVKRVRGCLIPDEDPPAAVADEEESHQTALLARDDVADLGETIEESV